MATSGATTDGAGGGVPAPGASDAPASGAPPPPLPAPTSSAPAGSAAAASAAAAGGSPAADDVDNDLFGAGAGWDIAVKGGGVRAFRIRNLDSGDTFHVEKATTFLEESGLTTFGVEAPKEEAKPTVRVVVIGAMQKTAADGKKFTSYSIEVHKPDTEKGKEDVVYLIERRFSDFVELDKMVRVSPFSRRRRQPLPKKNWFNSLSPDVVRARMAKLEAYLNSLIAAVPPSEFVNLATFLETNQAKPKGGSSTGAGTASSTGALRRAAPLALKTADEVPGLVSLSEAQDKYVCYVTAAT